MSTNFNFEKDKCWSCEFFSGQREFKDGIFFGEQVCTGNSGVCNNPRSNNYNKQVSENGWCWKYQKWGVLQSAIAREEDKRIQEQAEREQRQFYEQQERENQRQQEALRAERFRLEEERKRLEYERWYNSLTPEKRKQEDDRKEQERLKAEELRKQREEENRIKREKEEKEQKLNKKFQLIWAVLGLALFFTIIYLISAFSSLDHYNSLNNIVKDNTTWVEKGFVYTDRISEYTVKSIIGSVLCVLEILAIIITIFIYKRKKI